MATERFSLDEVTLANDATHAAEEARGMCVDEALPGWALPFGMRLPAAYVSAADYEEDGDDGGDDPDYEYVGLGELARRGLQAAGTFMMEHYIFFGALAIIVIGGGVVLIGRSNVTVLIFLSFVAFAILAVIALYLRWQEWHEKRKELERAEMLYEAAKKIAKEQGRDITRTRKSSGKSRRKRSGKQKDESRS